MLRTVLRLLLRYLVVTGCVILLNFGIPRLLPGDPLNAGGAEGLDGVQPLPAAMQAQLRTTYHLDSPLPDQFGAYLGDLARGDLGWSIAQNAPVNTLLWNRLPWTLGLLLVALLLSAGIGSGLGLLAGWV